MTTAKLSSKGQLVIPKSVRDRHGLEPGTKVELTSRGDVIELRRVREENATTWDELIGIAGYTGPRVSIEEMNAAVDRMHARFKEDRDRDET